jgi:hypothetical protein
MKKSIIKSGIEGLVSDSHRYKTNKGEISLLYPCRATMEMFEIYSIEGNLFEDVERYDSLQEAEERINELLNSTPNAQECDARDDDSSNDVGSIK